MRTEAQRRADARYRKKRQEVRWVVTLKPSDAEAVNKAVAAAGLSKAEFVRQAAKLLKK